MAIELGDNIKTGAPKPTDSRYLNNQVPWTSVSEVNANITGGVGGVRYVGLTVNINGEEYWYKNGIADTDLELKSFGGGSASGENITKLIEQTSHGFNTMDVVGWSGGTYNKAIADGTYDGEILGLVTKCHNANCFDLTMGGYVTGLTTLSVNSTYFLSDTTAGLLVNAKPVTTGHLVKPVIIADSTTSGWVLPYPPYLLSVDTGSTSSSSLNQYTITGNGSMSEFFINHGKNNQFVMVQVVENVTPHATVYVDVRRLNANCISVLFDTPPTSGAQFRVLVVN